MDSNEPKLIGLKESELVNTAKLMQYLDERCKRSGD